MKKVILISSIICITVMCFAFIKDNEPKFQNLKVLPKNIAKPQLDSIMKHFSSSLGVRCGFCHVRNEEQNKFDFAKDDKQHKLIARKMYTMMNKINKKYFSNDEDKDNIKNRIPEVSCYTCHHGKEEPENIPPLPQQKQ